MPKRVKKITSVKDLSKMIKKSGTKPVFIFKHDITDQGSEDAYQEYLQFIENSEEDIIFTLISVREDVEVSDAVEEMLEVGHQVPQIILLMDEEAVWDDEGDNITFESLLEVVDEYIAI